MATPERFNGAEKSEGSAQYSLYANCPLRRSLLTTIDCRADQIVEVDVDPRVSCTEPDLTEDGDEY